MFDFTLSPVLLLTLLLNLSVFQVFGDNLLVQTEYGPIEGEIKAGVRSWRSVPYAKPPVGNLRWEAPQEPDSWTNTLITTEDPPGCPQVCDLGFFICPSLSNYEIPNCVTMNVWAPLNPPPNGTLYPMQLFIHGGSFAEGYGGGLSYNLSTYVNYTNTVVFSINYRLGALGWLYDEITSLNGNFGLQDQILAIKFAYNNGKYFGGDNTKFTIYGESAGGISVTVHLMNNELSNIISGGIIESNPFGLPIRSANPNTWGQLPNLFKKNVGCDLISLPIQQLNCLKNANVSQIINSQIKTEYNVATELKHALDLFLPWTPTVESGDGLVNNQPIWAFQQGKLSKLAIINGINRDEGQLFAYSAFTTPVNEIEYEALIAITLGIDNAQSVINYYSNMTNNITDYRPVISQICTDGLFVCPNRNISASLAKLNFDDYFYHFVYPPSFNKEIYPYSPECWGDEVCHGAELPFVFRSSLTPVNTSYTSDEIILSQSVQTYWSNFGKTFNPGTDTNSETPEEWLKFDITNQPTMIMNIGEYGVRIENGYDETLCSFWDTTGYTWVPNSQ